MRVFTFLEISNRLANGIDILICVFFIAFQHREYFAELKQSVLQYDLMIDKLIIKVSKIF